MADKDLNLFDECAAENVSVPSGREMHFFFLKDQQNVQIWHHGKFAEETV